MSDDIVARARAALEGIDSLLPWVCYNHPPSTDYAVMARYIDDRGQESWWDLAVDNEGSWWSEGDAKFVVQSPGLVAELADEVERQRRVILRQERTIEGYESSAVRADELVAEVERLREACDFRTAAMKRDATELGALRAERDRLAATVERVLEALDRVVLDHRYTGEPTSPHYQGAVDYIRAALDGPNAGEGERDE